MSSGPAAESSQQAGDDNPILDVLKKPWSSFKKYVKTCRVVIAGTVPLHSLSPQARRELGVYEPWTFNVYESTLAGGIAIAVGKLCEMFSPASPESPSPSTALDSRALTIFGAVHGWLSPFVTSFGLFAAATLLGWASLRREDVSPAGRRRGATRISI
jgi:hypothetical protein